MLFYLPPAAKGREIIKHLPYVRASVRVYVSASVRHIFA